MKFICLLLLISSFAATAQTSELLPIRRLYQKAGVSKTDARQLQKRLATADTTGSPLLQCYRGATEMVQAKYTLNPMAKLDYFSRGKAWMIRAVSRDSANLEIRFIRYSVQSNLPAFLGYNSDTGRDKAFLLKYTGESPDTDLKQMIVNYLKQSGTLSAAEMKGLSN